MGKSLIEMARLSAVVPRGQEGFWSIMRALDAIGPFSIADVDHETSGSRGAVDGYFRALIKAGVLKQVGTRPNKPTAIKLYRLTQRPQQAPHVRADGTEILSCRQNLWRAVRSLKQFNTGELAFAASTPELPIKRTTAIQFVSQLAAAGYLTKALSGHGHEMAYRLKPAMNTGPLAPARLRINVVWDRNLKRVVGEHHVAEEVA
jgi:hypothetical protein